AGPVTLLRRSVVTVIAGQVETIQMRPETAAVQLQIAEGDPGMLLERRQVSLLVRVLHAAAGLSGLSQPGQALAHAVRRKILDGPVVLVPSAVLANPGHVEVEHGPHPQGK